MRGGCLLLDDKDLFLVPGGVHQVVVRYLLVDLFGLLGIHHLDEFGGHATPDAAGLDDGVFQYQRSGGHDGPFAHHGVVE